MPTFHLTRDGSDRYYRNHKIVKRWTVDPDHHQDRHKKWSFDAIPGGIDLIRWSHGYVTLRDVMNAIDAIYEATA